MGRTRVSLLQALLSGSIVLLAALGCGGISETPSPPGGGGGGGNPPLSSRFIYGAPGFETGNVQAGSIDSASGAVSAVPGSPFDESMGESNLLEITADGKGRFVYVLNLASFGGGQQIAPAGLCGFSINHQSGALTRVPGSPIRFAADNFNQIAVEGSGHFLVEANGTNSSAGTSFDVYSIDPSSGALTKTSSGSNAPPVGAFTVASSAGEFVFNAGNGLVEVFTIDASSGQLTSAGPSMTTAGSAGPLAVSADGKSLYVANQKEGTLAAFNVDSSGRLTPASASPSTIDSGAQYVTLTPDGKFLYIASVTQTSNDLVKSVKGYAVNHAAGTITPISGAVVNGATTVTVDLSGKFAYISSVGKLTTYSIAATTGALTQISQTNKPSSDDPNDMVTVM
jgi:6-phosphogluconolactonase (cycloisomerase 2 family)